MGTKKMDFQKMGVAHRFFSGAHFIYLFHGRRAHLSPISFLKCPLVSKKIMGNFPTDTTFFFYLDRDLMPSPPPLL